MSDRPATTTYGAVQTAKIAGTNTAVLRDWRRRGFLAVNETSGEVQYTALEVVNIWLMTVCSSRGIGPSASRDVALLAARKIVRFADHPVSCCGSRFLVWFDDGNHALCDSIDSAVKVSDCTGPVIVLDLAAMSVDLQRRLEQ